MSCFKFYTRINVIHLIINRACIQSISWNPKKNLDKDQSNMKSSTYKKIHVFYALTFIVPMVIIFSSGFVLLLESFL